MLKENSLDVTTKKNNFFFFHDQLLGEAGHHAREIMEEKKTLGDELTS